MKALFRADDNYKGGAVGQKLGSEADINTPWEHVRKESHQTSVFTSFSFLKKATETFSKTNIIKGSVEELNKLAIQGTIEIYTVDDVVSIMKNHPKKKIRIDANNVKKIMEKNKEVLIKGQIPASYIKLAN